MSPEQPVRVEQPKRPRACKRLDSTATRQERSDAHKVKMLARKLVNNHNTERYKNTDHIFANLGQNHPQYGDTPTEHEKRKNSS